MEQELYIYDNNGKRRKAVETICPICLNKFLRRKNSEQVYCSQECKGKARQKSVIVQCHTCGKKLIRRASQLKNSRSGLYFCNRKCKEIAQSYLGNCKEIQPEHYGSGKTGIVRSRSDIQPRILKGCVDCEIKLGYLLVTHHIDGDRTNNNPDNIEIVCRNCHAKRHLKFVDGEWLHDTHYLTPRDMLDKI